MPLVSWGLYSALGSPDLPSQPLAARLAADPAKQPVDELVARAEAHLAANPDDGRGWDVLAPVYLRLGRYADARRRPTQRDQARSARTAAREAGLGEAIAAAAGGMVTADAQAAFQRALELEPQHPKAQFFLASALAQARPDRRGRGRLEGHAQGLPADSPWLGAVDQALAEAEQPAGRRCRHQRQPAPTPTRSRRRRRCRPRTATR